MNKRIQELAEQAWDDTAIGDDGHPVSFAEKFAELIVRECAGLVEDYYDEDTNYLAGHIIRKHFGVE